MITRSVIKILLWRLRTINTIPFNIDLCMFAACISRKYMEMSKRSAWQLSHFYLRKKKTLFCTLSTTLHTLDTLWSGHTSHIPDVTFISALKLSSCFSHHSSTIGKKKVIGEKKERSPPSWLYCLDNSAVWVCQVLIRVVFSEKKTNKGKVPRWLGTKYSKLLVFRKNFVRSSW